ncbi:hypothetical protein [uncultured Sphingomonas sp.]|uniref:hypothetical protein n=1 Tax=uncultured Sphingomonas sp. TaxID=158754 RepID=UPI0035CC7AC3
MMLLLLALQAAAPAMTPPATGGIDGSPLSAIPRQQLPATGCAAFLWSVGTRHDLVAMASAEPARLRLSIDGKIVDLARADQAGAATFGFAGTSRYQATGVDVTLAMTVAADPNLTQGGTVPSATLTLVRPGQDSVVLPVAGLIGCAPAAPAAGQ